MLKSPFHVLIAGCLFSTVLTAASFEGVVKFKTGAQEGVPQSVAYSIKDGRLRIEMPALGAGNAAVVDLKTRSATIIAESPKQYVPVPAGIGLTVFPGDKDHLKLEKTNDSQVILGYAVDKWIASDPVSTTELWLSAEFGGFASFNHLQLSKERPPGVGYRARGRLGGPGMPPSWERTLAGRELFPLRVVSKEKDGNEIFRMEVTSIEKKPIDEALFTPPADYTMGKL